MDRGVWRTAVHGVAESRIRLSDLHNTCKLSRTVPDRNGVFKMRIMLLLLVLLMSFLFPPESKL